MTKSELLQTAKPILFNTEMVRAVLGGRKTETRRVIKYPPRGQFEYEPPSVRRNYSSGDILYVRETWNYGYWDSSDEELWFEELPINAKNTLKRLLDKAHYIYRANLEQQELDELERKNDDGYRGISWRPSIHMPKDAARIFLRVTDVSVERLQDITEEGCKREGIYDEYRLLKEEFYPKLFAEIWDRTVKDRDKYGWDANPWVWVMKFERIEVVSNG